MKTWERVVKRLALWMAWGGAGVWSAANLWALPACTAARFNDWKDLGCRMTPGGFGAFESGVTGNGGNRAHCTPCEGMPVWWVSEPYINLWVADEPLSYQTSSGQRMSFRFTYQQGGQLTGAFRTRELDTHQALVRLRVNSVIPSVGLAAMTNASWAHSFWSEIVFWDTGLEADPPAGPVYEPPPPATPTRAYFPMSANFEALVMRGDGGVLYWQGVNSGLAAGAGKWRLEVIGTDAFAPSVPVKKTSIPYPYPTSGLIRVDNPEYGFRVVYPDGSRDVYGLVQGSPTSGTGSAYCPDNQTCLAANNTSHALLTQRMDPQGRVTTVVYERHTPASGQPNYTVKYVVDSDGRTNTYAYHPANRNQLTSITDPYGRQTRFDYDVYSGQLDAIVDGAGLTNTFGYQAPVWHTNSGTSFLLYSGWMTSLTTPYGSTGFEFHAQWETSGNENFVQKRAVRVTRPDQSRELFLYQHRTDPMVPAQITPIPSVTGYLFDNGANGANHPAFYHRNSFHWGPRQYAALMGLYFSPPSFPITDVLSGIAGNTPAHHLARQRHWRLGADGISITDTLSSEREPSPDSAGQVEGAWTWYGYANQDTSTVSSEPPDPLLNCIARLLPDGTTRFTTVEYHPYAHFPTRRIESYTASNGALGTRTNTYSYVYPSWNDLTAVTQSGLTNARIGWNTNHQPTYITNALNEVTALTYNPDSRQLTRIVTPSGVTNDFTYYSSNAASPNGGMLQTLTLQPQGRVLTFTWTNGLPHTLSDERGLTLTHTWDGLNRLTSTTYPDGTYESNVYSRLDLGATRDRLGHWTCAGYDALGRLTALTNANNAITRLGWCDCGSLESITNALQQVTTLFYDNQGQLSQVVQPDRAVTYQRDALGRVTNAVDGTGRGLRLGYNHQGLLSSVSNAFGRVWSAAYDEHDRLLHLTGELGVTVTNRYDSLHRLAARSWAGGSEGYLWQSNGLAGFTNANGQVTRYSRDAAGRLLALTNANLEVQSFAYNSINQITDLWDARTNRTRWQYDPYGRLTNKLDALGNSVLRLAWDPAGRVTNRWTPQFGDTAYAHDAVGNLLQTRNAEYGLQNDYAYDLLNQLTNLVDAVGTTKFTWTAGGQLESEDGPWSDDTVLRAYEQGLRTNLTLGAGWTQSYSYDAAWRLDTLASPAGTFGYGYSVAQASSPESLVRSITLPNQARITNHFDALGRLESTALLSGWGQVLDGYGYSHDPLGLRTNVTRNLGWTTNHATALHDSIGQLVHWSAREPDNTPRLQEQLDWTYDPAGNLLHRTNNALVQTFANDERNRLGTITRTGTLTVSGNTPAPASSVTVNGQSAVRYSDFTFASTNHWPTNGENTFTIVAESAGSLGNVTNVTVTHLPTPVTPTYDLNGNLTFDGLRSFQYDAENQLTNVSVPGQWRSEFVYEGLGRKRIERDYTWTGGAWQQTNEVRFVYNGMLVLQERATNNAPLVTYTRGLDLSSTRQGAGGIGGLLARSAHSAFSLQHSYFHSDGAGNVTALMDAQHHIVARYLYDPFGRQVGQWGALAQANRMRFSSKPVHAQSGLYDYGYRHYDPDLQRWLTEDPLGEAGGANLYGFVGNSSLNAVDPYGQVWVLFDKQAWNQLGHDIFIGDRPPVTVDPNSFGALHGIDNDFNGKTGAEVAAEIGKAVPKGILDAAMMMGGAGEAQGAYQAADKLLKARKAVQCERAAAAAKKAADAAKTEASQILGMTKQQLQSKFKHAGDFGVTGNFNSANASKFSSAINQHINSPSVKAIQGTYRGNPVTHYVDPSTGLNAIAGPAGNFISGWKLSPQQLNHVLTTGTLGGG